MELTEREWDYAKDKPVLNNGGGSIKTLIKNGTIVNYDNRFKGDLLIEDGLIKAIGEELQDSEAELVDASGKYIFPGFIDAHTHPGLPEDLGYLKKSNDFYTETRAARAGGTTTIFDFAEQKKGQRLIEALREREKRYEGKAGCKYHFHVAITDVTEDIFEQLKEIKEAGVKSIKLYTTYGMKQGNEEILKIMDMCAKLNMVVLVHCEEDSIIRYCASRPSYGQTRPREAEHNMVNTVINFAKLTSCSTYICHVSCKESVELIRKAKKQGIRVYLETCPQYLILDEALYNISSREMTKYILSPPFRTEEDKEALIKACLDGTVDLISTDHCAFLYEEHKARFSNDLSLAAKGMPGIQLRGSLVYDLLVKKRHMRQENFIKLMSYNASQILALDDVGYIREGSSSDLVIWEEENFTASIENIIEGTDYTPYEGMAIHGKPFKVF